MYNFVPLVASNKTVVCLNSLIGLNQWGEFGGGATCLVNQWKKQERTSSFIIIF